MTEHEQGATPVVDELPASVRRVVEAAAVSGTTLEVTEFPAGTRTARDAATAVDCAVDQIVKSMIFDADGEIVLALTSGIHQVDPTALAGLAGVSACRRADPERVRAVTGYAIGGVAPIGHVQPIRAWLDPHLLSFEVVWAAAGTPNHVFPIAPSVLLELTNAEPSRFTGS